MLVVEVLLKRGRAAVEPAAAVEPVSPKGGVHAALRLPVPVPMPNAQRPRDHDHYSLGVYHSKVLHEKGIIDKVIIRSKVLQNKGIVRN